MSSLYPASFDELPANRDNWTPNDQIQASDHNSFAAAINKLQRTLGLNPQASDVDVAARLNALAAQINDLADSIVAIIGVPPSATQTLFVQIARPDMTGATKNSLWIPTNGDGTAKALSFWEVYSGFAYGDNGNLYIQEEAPAPVVDALWIPLLPDGTPKYLSNWVVFTGRGSAAGAGNPNLFISPARPSAPPPGSLWIPLSTTETALTPDHWEVFA